MNKVASPPRMQTVFGFVLVLLGIIVFAVRLQHDGAYAVPRGGNLFGGLGALAIGGLLIWNGTPRLLRWVALALSPVVLFSATYAMASEVEEVVSLYASNRAGSPAELRLWIVDRADGAWLGMPREKAVEHGLDRVRHELLRSGEVLCVVPVLHEDRAIVRAIHELKMKKYAVARIASSIGFYPAEAKDTTVALRVDPCPAPTPGREGGAA